MTIQTLPLFYFIDPVIDGNQFLPLNEPTQAAVEITAELFPGSRTLTDLAEEVERSLNTAGQNIYTVTFDRDTRQYTISGDAVFDLLITSGLTANTSVFSLIGFTGADLTGLATYTGDPTGSSYSPQFPPQKFKSFDDNEEGIGASVHESASGNVVESITFGTKRTAQMNLKYITDRFRSYGGPIANNQNAVQQARDALSFMIKKREFELMLNRDDTSVFNKVILQSTKKSKTGTAYELTELMRENLNEYYETGTLIFRKIG
jgi:hypothetical protein